MLVPKPALNATQLKHDCNIYIYKRYDGYVVTAQHQRWYIYRYVYLERKKPRKQDVIAFSTDCCVYPESIAVFTFTPIPGLDPI